MVYRLMTHCNTENESLLKGIWINEKTNEYYISDDLERYSPIDTIWQYISSGNKSGPSSKIYRYALKETSQKLTLADIINKFVIINGVKWTF